MPPMSWAAIPERLPPAAPLRPISTPTISPAATTRSCAATVIDDGDGVPFQIEYKFRPEGRLGRASLWLEDHGSWFGGKDGRPVEVFGTVRRIDDRHQRDQHLSFLGNCDPLTGMMNRGRLSEALGEAMSVAAREGTVCAFLIAAINNLSVVNEAYGFEVADEVVVNMGAPPAAGGAYRRCHRDATRAASSA